MAKSEQETTICYGRMDNEVQFYTNDTIVLKRMREDERFAEVKGGEDWGMFTVPAARYDPIRGVKRRSKPRSQAQHEAAVAALVEARKARGK